MTTEGYARGILGYSVADTDPVGSAYFFRIRDQNKQWSGAGAKLPKLKSLPKPEPKLRIAAPALFYLPVTTHFKVFYRKIMVAGEVLVNCYSFNPIAKLKKR